MDKIELPDIELTIKDQSVINAVSSEDLLLRERNPQFQEVYLEELTAHIEDASFEAAVSQRRIKKTHIALTHGSYNTAQVDLLAQDLVKNLYYYISYGGLLRGNLYYNGKEYLNTGIFHNHLQSYFSYNLKNAIVDLHLDYDQVKNSFFSTREHSQYVHYIPVDLSTRYWFNDISYLHFYANTHASILENRNILGVKTRSGYLLDSQFQFSYNVNFTEWNFFTIGTEYSVNIYDTKTFIHLGVLNLRTDFLLGKGFTLNFGMFLYYSSKQEFYGWPEFKLGYSYLEKFTLDFKCSGDYDLFHSETAAAEIQFFELNPSTEKKFIYALSAQFHPNAFSWISAKLAYDYYFQRRSYTYDKDLELYNFSLVKNNGFFNTGVVLGFEYGGIVEFIAEYIFENFPKNWLLYPVHKLDLLLGIGYNRVGFLFETHFILYSERYLTADNKAPIALLLSFKMSQKIYNRVDLFIEVRNVLNQYVQIVSGTLYGGVQAYGGIQVNF